VILLPGDLACGQTPTAAVMNRAPNWPKRWAQKTLSGVRSELAQVVNDQVLYGVLAATVLVFVLFAALLTLI